MITFTLYRQGDQIRGFKCEGHSGFSDSGTDVVCAAVTSAVRYCETIISDILRLNPKVNIEPESALIQLTLPKSSPGLADPSAQAALKGLASIVEQFRREYPENIRISPEFTETKLEEDYA